MYIGYSKRDTGAAWNEKLPRAFNQVIVFGFVILTITNCIQLYARSRIRLLDLWDFHVWMLCIFYWREDLHKVDAIEFAHQMAGACMRDNKLQDKSSAALLWNILILLCRQNGVSGLCVGITQYVEGSHCHQRDIRAIIVIIFDTVVTVFWYFSK